MFIAFNKYLICVIFHLGCFILILKLYLYQLLVWLFTNVSCLLDWKLLAGKFPSSQSSRYLDEKGPHTKPVKLSGDAEDTSPITL